MAIVAHTLSDQIDAALRTMPYAHGRHVRFDAHEGQVTLRGVVTTYFQKQMTQEAIRRVAGVEAIQNLIEVTWQDEPAELHPALRA